jgi:AmmeMemoRadiSam system protein B
VILHPAVAGSWYPEDPARLSALVDRLLAEAPEPPPEPPLALIAPHAGFPYSGAVAATAFACLRHRAFSRVLLVGPSHYASFRGGVTPEADTWRLPLGDLAIEPGPLLRRTSPFLREHCLEAELPFLQRALGGSFSVVPVLVGPGSDAADLQALADSLAPLLTADTLLVVSSDFTHFGEAFGYVPFDPGDADVAARIRVLDGGALQRIEAGDVHGFERHVERTGATICGRHAIGVLLRLPTVRRSPARRTLAYATSGAMTGSFEHSVSYAAVHVAAEGSA